MATAKKDILISIQGIEKGLTSLKGLGTALENARKAGKEVVIDDLIKGTSLRDLKELLKMLKQAREETAIDTEEYQLLNNAIDDTLAKIKEVTTEANKYHEDSVLGWKNQKKAILEAMSAVGEGTAEFERLQIELIKVNNKIKDFKDDVKGLTFEQQVKTVGEFASGLTATFSAGSALLSDYAAKGEEAQKTLAALAKAQLAIQLVQGVTNTIAVAGDIKRILYANLLNTALVKQIALYTGMTALQKLLAVGWEKVGRVGRAALAATGIGLAITAITTLMQKFQGLNKALEKVGVFFSGLFASIKVVFTDIGSWVSTFFDNMVQRAFKTGNYIKLAFQKINPFSSKKDVAETQKRIDEINAVIDKNNEEDKKKREKSGKLADAYNKAANAKQHIYDLERLRSQMEISHTILEGKKKVLEEQLNDERMFNEERGKKLKESLALDKRMLDEKIALMYAEQAAHLAMGDEINKEDKIALAQAIGERNALAVKGSKELRDFEKKAADDRLELEKIALDSQLTLQEDYYQKRKETGKLTFEEEKALIEGLAVTREQALAKDFAMQVQVGEEGKKNREKYAADLKKLEIDTQNAIFEAKKAAFQLESDLLMKGLEGQKTLAESRQKAEIQAKERRLALATQEFQAATNLNHLNKTYFDTLTATVSKQTEQYSQFQATYDLEKQMLETEAARIKLAEVQGLATQDQLNRLKEIETVDLPKLELDLKVNLKQAEHEGKEAVKKLSIEYLQSFVDFFENPVARSSAAMFQKVFGMDAAKAKMAADFAGKMVEAWKSALTDVNQVITDLQTAQIDAQLKQIDDMMQRADLAVQQTQAQLDLSRTNIAKFEEELKTATGAEAERIVGLIDKQRQTQKEADNEKIKAEKQKQALEKQKLTLEKQKQDAEKRGQQITAVTTAIDRTATAVAMVKGVAEASANPFPFNLIAIAATVAAVISAIASVVGAAQKFETGGVIQGASHAGGGVKVLGGRAEVEGGEHITNKRATANNLDALTTINELGAKQTFKAVPVFESGGVLEGLNNQQVSKQGAETMNNFDGIHQTIAEAIKSGMNGVEVNVGLRQFQIEQEKFANIQQNAKL